MIALGLISAGLVLAPAPLPSPAFRFRDPEIFKPGVFETVLYERSMDPDVRIFASQISLKSLNPFAPRGSRDRIWRTATNETVISAIASASKRFGVSDDYLTRLGIKESNLDRYARSPTSSAAGAFQFTENTWLCSLREFQADLSLDLPPIMRTQSGRCSIEDDAVRQRLLSLRHDAHLSADVAALLTRKHVLDLTVELGRPPTFTEVYALHFFGWARGKAYLAALGHSPHLPAEPLFPAAANANRRIFYDRFGRSLSLRSVAGRLGI